MGHALLSFLSFTLSLTFSQSNAQDIYTLPKQEIFSQKNNDEFSERVLTAPFTKVEPNPLQLTSPQFENLFSTLSSIQSRSHGSPTTSIRGSSQAGRVLFLLDDIPLNFLDGFGGSSLFVPTEILKSIHIFEGPSSAHYGSSALGGTIHFLSENLKSPRVRIGLSDTDTSYLEDEGTLMTANIGLIAPVLQTDHYQLQASTFLEKDRGDYSFVAPNGKNDRLRNNSQSLRRFTLLGHAKTENLELSHLLLYTGLNKRTPGSLYFPSITEQKSDAFMAALSSRYKTSNTTLWTSRLSYSRLDSDFYFGSSSFSNSDKFWISQGLNWELRPGWLSQTVIDLSHNKFQSSYAAQEGFSRSEPEIAQTFLIPVTDELTIEPTARHLTKYNHTLFQINIPYSFNNAKVWAMYAEGFRPPALIDLYAKDPTYVGNPHLTPEKSKQVEVGLAWNYKNLEISSALYQIDYQNLLQGTVDSFGVFSKINSGKARSYGSTTKLTATFAPWVYHLGYSSLLAREKTNGEPLLFSPEHQVFTSLAYQKSKWSLVLQQSLWSSFRDLNFTTGSQTRMAPWQSTDLLFFARLSPKLTGSFGVYNLFDHQRELTFGYPEPQRRTSLTLEYSF